MAVTTETFGTLRDGREARLFTISTAAGSSVTLTDFGATLVKLLFPDSLGRLGDVALGFDQLSMYEQDIGNFGAVCGRFANRLSRASLPLDRRVYPLVRNDGPNTLHGGAIGFHHRLWDAEVLGEDAVRFSRFSPDGEEGFPGDLTVSVTYRLTDEGVLSLDYEATAGAKNTVANLTNHTYWNLDGDTFGSILDDWDPIPVSYFHDLIDPVRHTVQRNGNDRLRFLPRLGDPVTDRFFKQIGIHIPTLTLRIHKDRRCAQITDGMGRCAESKVLDNHFISRTDPAEDEGQMDRRRSG